MNSISQLNAQYRLLKRCDALLSLHAEPELSHLAKQNTINFSLFFTFSSNIRMWQFTFRILASGTILHAFRCLINVPAERGIISGKD